MPVTDFQRKTTYSHVLLTSLNLQVSFIPKPTIHASRVQSIFQIIHLCPTCTSHDAPPLSPTSPTPTCITHTEH